MVVQPVDSTNHPVRVATIIGLGLADSNLAVAGLMPAGLSINVAEAWSAKALSYTPR